jgi:hypothetical protein
MATIRRETRIAVDADTVWDAVRDIGALHTRLVPGFVIDTRIEEGARVVTFGDGRVVREWIVDLDEGERRLAWAITDPPLAHYSASAQIFSEGDDACRFVWIANVLPDSMADAVAGMIERGLEFAKAHLESSARLAPTAVPINRRASPRRRLRSGSALPCGKAPGHD